MSNVVMCDAETCGAFYAEGMEGTSSGVHIDPDTGRQSALHYCDECTRRRKNARSSLVFRPTQDTTTAHIEAARPQD